MPGNDVFAGMDGQNTSPRGSQEEKSAVGGLERVEQTHEWRAFARQAGDEQNSGANPGISRSGPVLPVLWSLPMLAPPLDNQVQHGNKKQV